MNRCTHFSESRPASAMVTIFLPLKVISKSPLHPQAQPSTNCLRIMAFILDKTSLRGVPLGKAVKILNTFPFSNGCELSGNLLPQRSLKIGNSSISLVFMASLPPSSLAGCAISKRFCLWRGRGCIPRPLERLCTYARSH